MNVLVSVTVTGVRGSGSLATWRELADIFHWYCVCQPVGRPIFVCRFEGLDHTLGEGYPTMHPQGQEVIQQAI